MASLPFQATSATASSSFHLPGHRGAHSRSYYQCFLPSQLSPLVTVKHPFRRQPFEVSSPSRPRFLCRVGGSGGAVAEALKAAADQGKVRIRVRLDHQVEFGESVAIFGSHRPLGSWRNGVPMAWTEGGWVAELDLDGGDFVEYKFVVVPDGAAGKESNVWEGGENRVLEVPRAGVFDLVCQWNVTEEAVALIGTIPDEQPGEAEEGEGEEDDDDASAGDLDAEEASGGSVEDVEEMVSPFVVEQWGERPAASPVRSDEHGSREVERAWMTEGLQGVPALTKLAEVDHHRREGGAGSRPWWRKVNPAEASTSDMMDALYTLSQGIFMLISVFYRAI